MFSWYSFQLLLLLLLLLLLTVFGLSPGGSGSLYMYTKYEIDTKYKIDTK